MSFQITVPIFIALIAFLIADENSHLIQIVYRATLNLANRKSVETRLAQIGKDQITDYENYRISQLTYSVACCTFATISLTLGIIGIGIFLFLFTSLPLMIVALTERNLTKKVEKRKSAIETEFPAIVEMLTLAVGAGESPPSALKRITQRAHGHLAQEFSQVVSEVESGNSFTTSLDEMSKRLNSPSLRRFVDSLIISILRGTPLVETLSHSVNESRNQERVRLLTAAGKSEISMMIPVVFLILPISILFALYPSLTNLNLFSS